MPTRSDNAKTLLDNLLTAVILMDERLCIQFVNPAAEQLLSLSERRLIGIELPHLLEHISLDLQRFKQCLISGQGFTDSEVTLVVEIGKASPELSWTGDLSKTYGEADFELPLPTSHSPGTFTFTSINPKVATVTARTAGSICTTVAP